MYFCENKIYIPCDKHTGLPNYFRYDKSQQLAYQPNSRNNAQILLEIESE